MVCDIFLLYLRIYVYYIAFNCEVFETVFRYFMCETLGLCYVECGSTFSGCVVGIFI